MADDGRDRADLATDPVATTDLVATTDPVATTGSVAGPEPHPVATDETDRLIASDKVAGTEVFGREGQRLGTVTNFMVDKVTGRVAYAVMSFGGFLGLGERYHPLPWEALTYDPARGGYVVDVDPARLDAAPSFGDGEEPWRDPEHRRNVFGFYGFNYGL